MQLFGLAKKFVRLVNTSFNKILGENEKCLLLLLKTEGTSWPTQYIRKAMFGTVSKPVWRG